MTLIDLWMVRLHAVRIARRHGVASGDPRLREIERDAHVLVHASRIARRHGLASSDPRLREIERDALVLVREGASPREAVELAAVPVLRLYGLPRARAG